MKKKTTIYNNVPRHIAFIMDGNGRWAAKRHMPRVYGHEAGLKTLEKVLGFCYDAGIRIVSVFALSTENTKRPKEELDKLNELSRKFFTESLDDLIERGVQLRVMGDISQFSPEVQKVLKEAVQKTAHCKTFIFNAGINYGGRADICRAVNAAIASGVKQVDEDSFSNLLYTAGLPDPDLLVRTAECRISNFMLWQCAYSELYFTDVYWPAFNKKCFDDALAAYALRQRRYGLLR